MVKGTKRWQQHTVNVGSRKMSFWACEVRGSRPGPGLAVVAGQHGMEPTGPAALAAFLNELDPNTLRGVFHVVPMANTEALRCGYECEIPPQQLQRKLARGTALASCPLGLGRQDCGRNLNRLWPGRRNGSVHQRLVALMWNTVVADAEYVIDFHCWSDTGPPGVIFYTDNDLGFARQLGIPYLHRYPMTDCPGILSLAAGRAGKVAATVEVTPQTRITPTGAATTTAVLRNALVHLGMIPGKLQTPRTQYILEFKKNDRRPLTLPWDAVVIPLCEPGTWCRKGEHIGTGVRLDQPRTVRPLLAPCDGLFLGTTQRAVVAKGKPTVVFYRVRVL